MVITLVAHGLDLYTFRTIARVGDRLFVLLLVDVVPLLYVRKYSLNTCVQRHMFSNVFILRTLTQNEVS